MIHENALALFVHWIRTLVQACSECIAPPQIIKYNKGYIDYARPWEPMDLDADDVVQRAVPGQGVVPERKDKFVAPPLIIRPLCDRGSPFQSFNILLGLNGILPFSPVEKGDVRGPPDPIMSNQGLLNCCCHRERSVVRCREEWREVAAPTAQTKLLLKSFVTFV